MITVFLVAGQRLCEFCFAI